MEDISFVIITLTLFIMTSMTSGTLINVTTSNGQVMGTVEDVQIKGASGAMDVMQYRQFLGIPYAEPPIGNLRFKKPRAKATWTGAHNGTFRRPMCFQGPARLSSIVKSVHMVDTQMSEDCLTLDIYTPNNGTGSYPVMIFIHGEMGASNGYVGDVLSVFGDIVVVVINFRMSLFGFFSTGDDVSPGNYGLWDQHEAIKWVHDNIADFQGDPDRVTLTGSSIGASYVIFQAMYQGNAGLFQRVIAQSGSPVLCTCRKSSSLKNPDTKSVTTALGCDSGSSNTITECLKDMSLTEIYDALAAMSPPTTFTPVIDDDFILGEPKAVLEGNDSSTQPARDMFASVDMITGINDKEGGTHVVLIWSTLLDQDPDVFNISKTAFTDVVIPTVIDLIYKGNVSKAVEQLVTYEYSDPSELNNPITIREKVVELSTDIDMAVPTLDTVKLHAQLSSRKSYLYEFSANTNITAPVTPSWLDGANHGDEIYFLFGFSRRTLDAWSHSAGFVPTDAELTTSMRLMMLWSNFMKTGDPNTSGSKSDKWTEFEPQNSAFADISHDATSSRNYFREPAMTFWTKVVPGLMDLTPGTSQQEEAVVDKTEVKTSGRLHVDLLLSENLLLVLIVMCACLVCAYCLLCCLTVSRNNVNQYNLKVV